MTDRLHISDESSSTSKLAAMSSTSSNGSGSGGLSARLEARLNAATRRTQALADAVEESLASSALPSSAAGLEGGGAAGGLPTLPALPTPLRSLVAQLLAVGGGQQQQQPEEEKEARPSAPVLVELRGAGLGRVNGLYRADTDGEPNAADADPPVRYRRVDEAEAEEEGALAPGLELFLGACGVCGAGPNKSLCDTTSGGCVRSWYVGDAKRREVYYLASASPAEATAPSAPPLAGWRVAAPHGAAPAPRLVYHHPRQDDDEHEGGPLPPTPGMEAAAVGSSVGGRTGGDAAFLAAVASCSSSSPPAGAASSGGFACAMAATTAAVVAEGNGGCGDGSVQPGKTAHVAQASLRRRRRGRRVSSVVMEEEEGEGATEADMAAAAAAAVAAAVAPLPPPSPPHAPITAAARTDGAVLDGDEHEQQPVAATAAAPVSGGEEGAGLVGQLQALEGGYAAAARALAAEERALRAAVRDAEARAAAAVWGEDGDGGDDSSDVGEGEGRAMPLSFEARVRALWQRQRERGEVGEREQEEGEEKGVSPPPPPQPPEDEQAQGGPAGEEDAATAAALEEAAVVGDEPVGLLLQPSDDGRDAPNHQPQALAPLRVEVLGLERARDDALARGAAPRFLLRLTSLELPPASPRQRQRQRRSELPPEEAPLPVHRVRVLRRPRAALLALHEQLAALLLLAPLPPFPASSMDAGASTAPAEATGGGALRASLSLLAGGGGGGGTAGQHQPPQQQRRWEECRRVEAYLTALVHLVEGSGSSPWPRPTAVRAAAAAALRGAWAFDVAEQAAGRADVVVRLHTDPCPGVTAAERQALWAAQGGRCRGCGARLAQGRGLAARLAPLLLAAARGGGQPQEEDEQPRPFMTCRYLRRLFCMGPACGGGGGQQQQQEEPRAVLPGPALRGWDFRPRRVSRLAAAYLEAVRALPLVPLPLPPPADGQGQEESGEGAAKARRALEYVGTLCRQLGELARGCGDGDGDDDSCPAAARMLAEAARPVPAPWQLQQQEQGEEDGDDAAMAVAPRRPRDVRLSLDEVLALRGGRLTGRLIVAVEALDAHVVEQCSRCRAAAAQPCALCQDDAAPIFSHHFWSVARCGRCGALAHRACLRSGGGGAAGSGCPRCGAAAALS